MYPWLAGSNAGYIAWKYKAFPKSLESTAFLYDNNSYYAHHHQDTEIANA